MQNVEIIQKFEDGRRRIERPFPPADHFTDQVMESIPARGTLEIMCAPDPISIDDIKPFMSPETREIARREIVRVANQTLRGWC